MKCYTVYLIVMDITVNLQVKFGLYNYVSSVPTLFLHRQKAKSLQEAFIKSNPFLTAS
jgi:hypothetical protein